MTQVTIKWYKREERCLSNTTFTKTAHDTPAAIQPPVATVQGPAHKLTKKKLFNVK